MQVITLTLDSLTKLSCRSLLRVEEQSALLLQMLAVDPRLRIKLTCTDNLKKLMRASTFHVEHISKVLGWPGETIHSGSPP